MIEETVKVILPKPIRPTCGSAGLQTQLPGMATTVSNLAAAAGGMGNGTIIERDIK